MKLLVTGGAGFIGSAVVRHIIRNTHDSVVNLDKLTYAGNLESLTDVSDDPRYAFEQVDICDRTELDRVFAQHQPDAVMHLAAESHVDRSIDSAGEFIQTNIVGTFNLLEAARAYWQRMPSEKREAFRFHHISTDEVYGDLHGTDDLFTETTPYAPSSPYSASKASSDHLVRAWLRTYGLPTIVTNCSNNYGSCHFPEKLIPLMILNALDGNIEVVKTICALLEELVPEKPVGVARYEDLITFVQDRPGHDVRYAIDAAKIGRELGWKPQETFESGIRKTVQWYLDNKTWWQNVLNGSYRLERLGTVK